jgi:hypothetical protein
MTQEEYKTLRDLTRARRRLNEMGEGELVGYMFMLLYGLRWFFLFGAIAVLLDLMAGRL